MTGEHGMTGYTTRVRDAIYEHVFAHPESEVGGVLVGARLGEGAPLLLGSVRADNARGDLTSLTFTHDAWTEIHAAIERDHPGSEIVGWYHSHPGHGIFLSGHDEFIHKNFFADPGCVALVVDPVGGREGLFGWESGTLCGFWERETAWPGVGHREDGLAHAQPQAGAPRQTTSADAPVARPAVVSRSRTAPRGNGAPAGTRGVFAIPLALGVALGVLAALGLHAIAGVVGP